MLQLSTSATVRNNILRGSRFVSIKAALSSQPDSRIGVAEFLEDLLSSAPQIVPSGKAEFIEENGKTICVVRNVRGRPAETFKLSNTDYEIKADLLPREEEMFSANGTVFEPPENLEDFPDSVEELHQIPANYEIRTRFHSCTHNGQILHLVEHRSSRALAEGLGDITPLEISKILPLKLDEVRLGFENYRSRVFWIFGLVPIIESRFYLECNPFRIFLYLEENLLPKQRLPLEETGIVLALDKVLERQQLFSGFTERLRGSIMAK